VSKLRDNHSKRPKRTEKMANKKKGEKHCHSILDNKTNNKRIQLHFSQPLKKWVGKKTKRKKEKTMSVSYEKVVEIVRLKQVVCDSTLEIQKITSSFGIAQWLMDEIGNETQEVLMLLCLNTKNEVNSLSVVHRGTINQSIAHPRDIFQRAILSNATRICIAHNHPSGNPQPSEADKLFTERIKEAGDLLGISLLDHLVVTSNRYYSFRENGGL